MLLTTTTTYLITPHPLTWKARLYVAKSLLKHALVSLIESSSTSVSRARMSCIIRPSEGISEGSALFSSLARTKSCRLWQNLDTISSLKGMSCLTWLMYGYST